MMRDPHDVLGVAADADSMEIRAAYVARLRTAHPDAGGAGEPVSDIVRAYRALRAASLRKRRSGIGSSAVATIAMHNRRGLEPPVPRPSRAAWWGRGTTLIILFLAIGGAVYASSRLRPTGTAVAGEAKTDGQGPSAVPEGAELRAIEHDVLRQAVAAVRRLNVRHGAVGLEEHSRRCFAVLAQSPTIRLLDYCLAFDSAATSTMLVAGSAGRTGTEAFFHPGTMSHRHAVAIARLLPEGEAAEERHSEVEVRAVSELALTGSN